MGVEGVLFHWIHHEAVSMGISADAGQSIDLLSLRPHAEQVHEEEDTPGKEALSAKVPLPLMDSLFNWNMPLPIHRAFDEGATVPLFPTTDYIHKAS